MIQTTENKLSPEEISEKLDLLQKVLNEKLLKACEEGDYLEGKEAIEQGADVNCRNHEGLTPIHLSTAFGRYDILNLLLDKNAYINSTTSRGDTALSIAKGAYAVQENVMMSNFLSHRGGKECPQM